MDQKRYLQLEDLDCYRIAADLSQYVWQRVRRWDRFVEDTIGKQFVRAVDSISSNIAEGFGRFHKKDKILFYKYSYGSVSESTDWNERGENGSCFPLKNTTTERMSYRSCQNLSIS